MLLSLEAERAPREVEPAHLSAKSQIHEHKKRTLDIQLQCGHNQSMEQYLKSQCTP